VEEMLMLTGFPSSRYARRATCPQCQKKLRLGKQKSEIAGFALAVFFISVFSFQLSAFNFQLLPFSSSSKKQSKKTASFGSK
jgi:uncharacterized paraquat-inducible protein A